MNEHVKSFTKISDFLDYLGLNFNGIVSDVKANLDLSPTFPFYCSKHYANLIKKAVHPECLLREILPSKEELAITDGFVDDPVGDLLAGKSERIIQKYDNRALIIATSACGVRCRFCFRRNYPFLNSNKIAFEVSNWLDVHSDIWEVILSGGDPLSLDSNSLNCLIEAIASHSSVSALRIHSRLPIMRPDLVQKHLDFLRELPARLSCVLISHVNHYEELDEASAHIFAQLKKEGWTILNQSVLLKGVNDNADTLINLSRKLFEQGVIPYYLHQLDHAKGVAHFEVSDAKAKELIAQIRTKLPGYLVPRLVREIAGEKSKTPIT